MNYSPKKNFIKLNKKVVGYSIFFIVLTGLFLFFLFRGTDKWKAKSPVLEYVKPFSFTTQEGKLFTEQNLKDKVTVVNFFFTTCKGICPRMNGNLYDVYQTFKNQPGFQIISHTSDPEIDNVAKLKRYADSLQVSSGNWFFLTGRKDSLYNAARTSYLLDDPKNNVGSVDDQFLHTQFFAVVDKEGNVRGHIYDGLKKDDVQQLKEDVKKLLEE